MTSWCSAKHRLQRDALDVEVQVAFQRRVYTGTRHTVRRRVRLVAVRLPESTEHRFYVTNIDPHSFDAQSIVQIRRTLFRRPYLTTNMSGVILKRKCPVHDAVRFFQLNGA